MNKPSSTITATAIAAFLASTFLLCIKIFAPEIYVQIPATYHGYLVGAIAVAIGYYKKENVLLVVGKGK